MSAILKQSLLLQFLYCKLAKTCQIDSNKVLNPKLKLVLYNCAKRGKLKLRLLHRSRTNEAQSTWEIPKKH